MITQKRLKQCFLLLIFSLFLDITVSAQCFLKIIRLSDISVKIEGTGNATSTPLDGAQIQFVTSQLFSVNPQFNGNSFTKADNTLKINNIGPTTLGGAFGDFIILPYGNIADFDQPPPYLEGPTLTATGAITLNWSDGVVSPVGSQVGINHVSLNNRVCNVLIEGDSPTPAISITTVAATAAENSGTALTYRFTATAAPAADLTINFEITSASTAPTNDFTITKGGSNSVTYNNSTKKGTIVIKSGQTTADLSIVPIGDTTIEDNETVIVAVTTAP